MAANLGINFLVHTEDFNINLNDEGYMLGFFGSNPNTYLQVGSWNDTTYMVDSNEDALVQGQNVKYATSTKAYLGENTEPLLLIKIPNYQSTMNVRFKHGSDVRVLIARCRFYNRELTTDDAPNGVSVKIAESVHVGVVQNIPQRTKGDSEWRDATSGSWLFLSRSPGPDGQAGGTLSSYAYNQHDWFLNITVSPDTIGKRSNLGLQFSVEYL